MGLVSIAPIALMGLSGCATSDGAFANATTADECRAMASQARVATFTSASDPGAALAVSVLSIGITAASVNDRLDKCLARVEAAPSFGGGDKGFAPATAYAPMVVTGAGGSCSSVMVGGSGYCSAGQ